MPKSCRQAIGASGKNQAEKVTAASLRSEKVFLKMWEFHGLVELLFGSELTPK